MIKTEQEQIEVMQKDFCKACKDNFPNGFVCPWQRNLTKCCQCKIVCEIFYQAGYGDVSEYKSEIERLKAEFKQLETNAEILARGVRDLNHENYELTEKVKQTKIETLIEVKSRCVETFVGKKIISAADIDELINEVQNETV